MTGRSVVRVIHAPLDNADFHQLVTHLHDAGTIYIHRSEPTDLFGEARTRYVFDILPPALTGGPTGSRLWAERVAERMQGQHWNAVVTPEWTEVKP